MMPLKATPISIAGTNKTPFVATVARSNPEKAMKETAGTKIPAAAPKQIAWSHDNAGKRGQLRL
jgi:hypothetical protein